ncbi:MAG TPA: ABC transporter permease subunit [Chloroflexota bacterium]|nr:ABC transporter permease subunit [Chloroflexota bacterium]
MRLAKAWTVTAKDFKTFTKRRTIVLYLVGFELVVSIALPVIARYAGGRSKAPAQVLPQFINAFSLWFFIGAAVLPVSIASYSLVGEKLQKSLEPLLAAPVSDDEVLVGKGLAALLPTLVASYLGAVVFMLLIDVFTAGRLGYRLYPNWTIGVILLLLVPLAALFSVSFNVLISARANDVRTAQQLGTLPILPLFGLYILTEIGVVTLSATNLLIIAGVLAAIDVVTLAAALRTFRRDAILTSWR